MTCFILLSIHPIVRPQYPLLEILEAQFKAKIRFLQGVESNLMTWQKSHAQNNWNQKRRCDASFPWRQPLLALFAPMNPGDFVKETSEYFVIAHWLSDCFTDLFILENQSPSFFLLILVSKNSSDECIGILRTKEIIQVNLSYF